VLAAEREAAAGQVLNVVDDETPTQRQYVSLLRKRTSPRPRVIGLPWWGIRSAARLAWLANKLLLGNRARLPGILIPCRVHARFKPLKYTNRRIKEVLGWKPRYSLVEAIDRSMGRAARAPAPAPRAPADFPPVADADDARPPALVRREAGTTAHNLQTSPRPPPGGPSRSRFVRGRESSARPAPGPPLYP
jgi:hypothetical protein